MTEPIKKNNDRETWGDLEFRWPAGTHHAWTRELEPGDLIAYGHRVWRVIAVEVLEDRQVRTVIRPAADDPTWTATDADKHLCWQPHAQVPRYPQADHVRCDYSDLPPEQCAHCTGATEHRWSLKAAERLTHVEPDTRTWRPVSNELGAGRLYSPSVVPMPSHGSPCQACGKLAGDYFVCPACIEQLECDCANIPAMVEQLNVTITRLDNVYTPSPPASAEADEPMPFGMAASTANHELKAALVLAALTILRRRGQEWEGEDSAEAVAAWLGVSSASVALDPDAGPVVLSIREAVGRALKAIDTMPERILAGPCPDCGTRLMAFKDAAKVWCDVCQERHQVADLKSAMLDKLADERGSVNALHEMLRAAGLWVPLGTVKWWSSEGALPMVGITKSGSREHRFGDLMVLVEKRRESGLTSAAE